MVLFYSVPGDWFKADQLNFRIRPFHVPSKCMYQVPSKYSILPLKAYIYFTLPFTLLLTMEETPLEVA